MKNFIFGQYVFADSILHRADPRLKIILLIALIGAVFCITQVIGLLIFTVFIVILSIESGLRLNDLLKVVKFSVIFIFFAVFSSIFKDNGDKFYLLQAVPISLYGVSLAAVNVLKTIEVIIISVLITRTTTPLEFVKAIDFFLKPVKHFKKIDVSEIGLIMVIAIRFIPVIFEEAEKIMIAQKVRGVDANSNTILYKLRSFTNILGPLFLSTFKRAESLSMAVDSRCMGMRIEKTNLNKLNWGTDDGKLVILCLIMLFISFYSKYFLEIFLSTVF